MARYFGLVVLVWVALFVLTTQDGYKKVIHNYDPEAKCLDGSPAAIYVHEGGDPKNILIYFQGGGFCGEQTLNGTLQSCYQRSKTNLGSSKYWPDQIPAQIIQGYLSLDPEISSFSNWTKFIFGYCDGAFHQGISKDPVKYKDTSLYFRGAAITRSHFDWINEKYGLKEADKIVLTGASAGGVAVALWNNYLKDYVREEKKVYPIADSGAFSIFKTHKGDAKIEKQLQNIYKLANSGEPTPMDVCDDMFLKEEYKCYFLQNTYRYIFGRFMIINSEYDSWAIENILDEKCLKNGTSGMTLSGCNRTQMSYIEKYRDLYMQLETKFFVRNDQFSFWSISCSNHVYASLNAFYNSPNQKVPAKNGFTVRTAVEAYVHNNKRVIASDTSGWPANAACAH